MYFAEKQSTRTRRRGAGFTLIELLVVIGILMILAAILIPAINAVRRSAERKAVQADFQTIGVALDEYKKDHGDYPRPSQSQRSMHVLVWALIGSPEQPHPFRQTPGGNGTIDCWDGAPGPGFRTMWNTMTQSGSRVWGPYLPPDKFVKSSGEFPNPYRWDFQDRYGTPIEYFPRWRVFPKVAGVPLFGTTETDVAIYDYHQMWREDPDKGEKPDGGLDVADNKTPLHYLRRLLGDENLDDRISDRETLVATPPYLLLSRGPAGRFTPKADVLAKFNKCLEISNLNER